jgi:hypothetical protein
MSNELNEIETAIDRAVILSLVAMSLYFELFPTIFSLLHLIL